MSIFTLSGKNFLNSIEYLDPDTMEWTNFTMKPDGYKSNRKTSKSQIANGSHNGDEESHSETHEDFSASELDTSIPEELEESSGCGDMQVVNGIMGVCEPTNVH